MTQNMSYILQDQSASEFGKVPRTLRLPDLTQLKLHGKAGMNGLFTMTEEELARLDIVPVKESTVVQWGLRSGDILFTQPDAGSTGSVIAHVSGSSDKTLLSRRPVLVDEDVSQFSHLGYKPQVLTAAYPQQAWNLMCAPILDDAERVSLRVEDVLAKFGKGMSSGLKGAPQTGKTFLLRSELKAWAQMTLTDPKLWIINVFVGERQADDSEIDKVLASLHGNYVPERFLRFSATDRTSDAAQSWLCSYAMEVAQALVTAGNHVVVLMDSASRWLVADSSASEIHPKDSPLISQGIRREALNKVRRALALAGDYGIGTLTMRSTMLWFPPEDPRARSYADGILANQTADSTMNHLTSTYPSLDLDLRPSLHISPFATSVRMGHLLCTPAQLEEERVIRALMKGNMYRDGGKISITGKPSRDRDDSAVPETQLRNLIQICTDHPYPADTAGSLDGWWKAFTTK